MSRRGDAGRPLPKRTLERLAACEAVGLHYWSDHPAAQHVWAVDDHQQAHVVRIDRGASTAQHICRGEPLVDEAIPFNTNEENHLMTTQKENRPTQGEAVQGSEVASPSEKERPAANISQPSDLPVNGPSANRFEHAEVDPFAPEANLVAGLDASFKKNVVVIKEGKPKKDEFFWINPDPDYIHDYWLLTIDDGMSKENYIILPKVRHLVPDNVHPYRVFVGINLHDTVFVWPVRLYTDGDGGNGGGRSWSDSALEHIETAKSLWIKIRGNRSSGAYEATEAQGLWEEPKWPAYSFRDLMEKAFKGKVVDSPDHAAIRKIFGDGQR